MGVQRYYFTELRLFIKEDCFVFQLLPDSVVDPMELLSYLDPPDLATPPSSGASSTGNAVNTTNDDILALFE